MSSSVPTTKSVRYYEVKRKATLRGHLIHRRAAVPLPLEGKATSYSKGGKTNV